MYMYCSLLHYSYLLENVHAGFSGQCVPERKSVEHHVRVVVLWICIACDASLAMRTAATVGKWELKKKAKNSVSDWCATAVYEQEQEQEQE